MSGRFESQEHRCRLECGHRGRIFTAGVSAGCAHTPKALVLWCVPCDKKIRRATQWHRVRWRLALARPLEWGLRKLRS